MIRSFSQIQRASNTVVRRGGLSRSQTEQGLEGGHRLLAPIVSKDKLIEVNLELSAANAVIGTDQPLLEVADGAVGQRYHRRGPLAQIGFQRLRARDVLVPCLLQPREALQTVSIDRGARSDIVLDEGAQRSRLKVWDHRHTQPPRRFAAFFNGHQDQGGSASLELTTTAQTCLGAANPSLIDLHLSTQWLARRVDHGSAQLVEHHPCRLISAQFQLALEQKRGNPTFIGRHQVRGPKPQRQGDSRVVENRPRDQRNLMPTCGALPESLSHHGIRALLPAARTREAIRPTTGSQIFLAGLFAGELPLKFAQTPGKRRARHALTLHLVSC